MTGESIYLKRHKTIPIGVIYQGTATGSGVKAFTDTNIPASYLTGIWDEELLYIFAGKGAGQTRKIDTYTAGGNFTLYDDWTVGAAPNTTSRYQVISGTGISGGAAVGDATAANQALILADIGDFSAQVNLQSLLAALGVPDVAGKPMYTCLVTDRLDHGTHGLSALDTDLGTIITDTEKIFDVTLGASPIAGSLASFIASGGTALGTQLPASTSLYDVMLGTYNRIPAVTDVIIYPVAEHAGTTEIIDDGTSPAFYADTESGNATTEPTPNLPTPNVHWIEDIDFEREGSIAVISIFAELRWQHKTAGGTAYSKVQMSRNGGTDWVDMTDSIAETNVAYQNKTRIGVGRFVNAITAGVDQLKFRLVSWEAGTNLSSAKMRSDSYIRITYRKS